MQSGINTAFDVRIFTNFVTDEWSMYIFHTEHSLNRPTPREIMIEINLLPEVKYGLRCADFRGSTTLLWRIS